MNDLYNKDYMLNIGPGGISLIAVNNISSDFPPQDTFEIQIDMQKSMAGNFNYFYNYLMERLSEELVYKVMEGEIYNGDLLRLMPTSEGKKVMIKVTVFRHLNSNITKNIDTLLKKSTTEIPQTIEAKKEEMELLRDQLNLALDTRNYDLCENIVQKINYIKDEFLI